MPKARHLLTAVALALVLSAAGLAGWSAEASSAPLSTAPVGNVTTRFSASRDGFAFINRAAGAENSFVGRVFYGLCGGMSYAALDYYWSGKQVHPDVDRFLLRRDADSIVSNAVTFAYWTLSPDKPTSRSKLGVMTATRERMLPELAAKLRSGPAPLGLVKARDLRDVGRNHQVVAYGMKRAGSIVDVRIYDPNHPKADDAVLRVDLSKPDAPVVERRGERAVDVWRGFFVEPYAPVQPPVR